MRYPVAAPDLSGNELRYVTECLESSWISSAGRFISEFETRFAQFTQAKYAVATCNGTVALHLALHAMGIGPGDEVIVPSLTFCATANAVVYCGAEPVFADSDPNTWCLSPASVERMISPRTKAIIPVHLYGHPCDMEAITAIAAKRDLRVIEDCAEALDARLEDRPVGALGDAGTFSFFGNKILTTGEGGMVVTQDEALAARLRLLRGQGMDPHRRYWHPVIGFNYRMTNIEAAIGLAQLERVEQLVAHRKQLARWYTERLADVPQLTLPTQAAGCTNVYWLYSLLTEDVQQRDRLMARLAEREIETRPFFCAVHEFPSYRRSKSDRGCPIARDLAARGLSLPTSMYLSEADVDYIAAQVKSALAAKPEGRRHAA